MFRTALTSSTENGNKLRGTKRRSLGSMVLATFGMMSAPCLADDLDPPCTLALAKSHELIKATYGGVVDGVELSVIDHWENTPYHPGSEQLAFVLRSKGQGKVDGSVAARAHALMNDHGLQNRLSRSIVQACPCIDVVSYRFEQPEYAISYSRQADGVSRSERADLVAQASSLFMP